MAETKQPEFGVNTQFQSVTPHTRPDFRAENIKSGVGLAVGLGKAEASEAGREAGRALTGQSLADANRDLDIFEETLDNNITDAMVQSGGTINERQIAEVRDATLRNVKFKARGLQEGITRGVLSHLEASARATLEVQRASNSLIGSLFQNEFRNAMSGVTGNPAGSPAVALNKNPSEVQREANTKALNKARAERNATIQIQADKDRSTFGQAEFKLVAFENKQQEVARMEQLDKEGIRSDGEIVSKAGTQFAVAITPLMDNITAAQVSGQGLDPNEESSLTQQIKVVSDQIVNTHILQNKVGKGAQKELREMADVWKKDQIQYIRDISAGKITKENQALIAAGAQNLLASEMPLVYAMSKLGSPQLAQTLAMMEPEARREMVTRLGFSVENMMSLTDEFLRLKTSVDPQVKTKAKDVGVLAPVMSMASGDANKKTLDEFEENGISVEDLAQEWKASPETSLMTVADSLSAHINAGDKNSVKAGVSMINESRDKYFRLIQDYDVQRDFKYTVQKNPGLRHPDINIPEGLPEGEQQIVRQLYRAVAATPALWREDFASPQEAFEAVMAGHKLTNPADQIVAGSAVSDFFTEIGHSISQFAGTEASRIRGKEGIELTEPRGGDTPERAKRVLALREKLLRQTDIDAMLQDMAEEELSNLEKQLGGGRVSDVPIDRGTPIGEEDVRKETTNLGGEPAVSGLPPKSTGKDAEGKVLTGNQNEPAVTTSTPPTQKSQNIQGERGAGTTAVIKEINPDVDKAVQGRVQQFENSIKKGFDGSVWKPHISVEGGTDTIAYGHKLTSSEAKSNTVKLGKNSIDLDKGITEQQAQELFSQDWEKAGKGAKKIIKDNNLGALPSKAKSILQEMVFQMGEEGVSLFKNTIKLLQNGEFDKAADGMLNSKWAKKDSPERASILAEEMRSLER